jgi:hypothetical protein
VSYPWLRYIACASALVFALVALARAQTSSNKPVPNEPSGAVKATDREAGSGSEGFRGTIVIVRQKDDDRVVLRLRAELEASAWRVVEIGSSELLRRVELADLAKKHFARAAIRVRPSRSEIDLWIEEPPGTGDGFTETLSSSGSKNDEKVLARISHQIERKSLRDRR